LVDFFAVDFDDFGIDIPPVALGVDPVDIRAFLTFGVLLEKHIFIKLMVLSEEKIQKFLKKMVSIPFLDRVSGVLLLRRRTIFSVEFRRLRAFRRL
jgi:hypothetical protein